MLIENDLYLVECEDERGRIRRLLDKVGGLDLITEPRLAGTFRLLVPLPDLQGNYLSGDDQRLSGAALSERGMVLRFDGPLASRRGPCDIDVTMRIALVEQSVEFRIEVRNRSPYPVAEVWYPLLGGIQGIGERRDTRTLVPHMGWTWEHEIFQDFRGMVELGTPVPECVFPYSTSMSMPWADLYNPRLNRGVYLACHDPAPRMGALRLELHPGLAHGRTRGSWPRPEELGKGLAVGVVAHWVSFPYTPPSESFSSPPFVVQFHEGDWHQGALLYRAWFQSRFPIQSPRENWIRRESAFQNAMLLLPEGNVQFTFPEIAGWAKAAREYGVSSVLVSGWDRGGHDNLYPSYEPDPRLGTWEDLREAIDRCHEIGMKVFFFVNLQPVDCTTDWYRSELERYRSMDPWGCSTVMGWGMGTLGARMGFTRRPMVKANPAFDDFRCIIVRQMKRLAEAGADGLHIDKLNSVGLDFNPALPLSPDRASCEGILQALREIRDACSAVRPGFALSVESAWDRTLQFSNVAWVWHSTWALEHVPAYKFTFPQWAPAIAVCQPYDYNVVNSAVRFGYQMLIGPAHYTSSMADEAMKPLSDYIREIQRIREELADLIFLGQFLDTMEVRVHGDAEIRYSVHRDPETGRRACVLVNHDERPHRASLEFDRATGEEVRIYEPFNEARLDRVPLALVVPAERLAIVVEEGTAPQPRPAIH